MSVTVPALQLIWVVGAFLLMLAAHAGIMFAKQAEHERRLNKLEDEQDEYRRRGCGWNHRQSEGGD